MHPPSGIKVQIHPQGSVASLGGRTAPDDTLQGVTPEGKNVVGNLQRIVDKRGQTGKKRCRVIPSKGVTPE